MLKSTIKIVLIVLYLLSFNIYPVFAEQVLTGPVLGNVSSLFGLRKDPILGFTKYHHGIDIAAPYGTPVYAMQDGIVTKSGDRGGYGLAVTIDHYYPEIPQIPRVQTTYGHNSILFAKVGQFVRRGQVISLVGSTGRSTGPHVHFEVTYKGNPVDPVDYLIKLPSYLDYVARVRGNTRYVSNQYGSYR